MSGDYGHAPGPKGNNGFFKVAMVLALSVAVGFAGWYFFLGGGAATNLFGGSGNIESYLDLPESSLGELTYYQGHTYQVVNESMNWFEAQEVATSAEGNLVYITSQEEEDFVNGLIRNQSAPKFYYWLGATDDIEEGVWQWTNGYPLTYTDWAEGEPNASFEDEDYLVLTTDTGKWNDLRGSGGDPNGNYRLENSGFIIEWPGEVILLIR